MSSMLIDAHTHLLDRSWLPIDWWRWLEKYHGDRRRPLGPAGNKGKSGIESLWDPDGTRLLTAMDDAGLDQSIILPLDFGLRFGEPETSIAEQHRLIHRVVRAHPGRLVGFVGVDPRRAEALDIIRHGVRELGFKGVKLHPGAGFPIDSETMDPLWELVCELDVPVIVHTGHAFGPLLSRHCRPLSLDAPLARYPDARIVAAHLAGGWFDALSWMGYTKPNLYADISLRQIEYRKNPKGFASTIRKALDMFGPERLLFGTDWPFTADLMPPKDYVQAVTDLAADQERDIPFISAEIKGLLGRNARKLLGE